MNEMANPANHQISVFRFSTIELILSVTDANVSPGSITGDVASISLCDSFAICGLNLNLRVWISYFRQVRRPRPCIQFAQKRIVPLLCFQTRNATVGIVGIAKNDYVSWAYCLTRCY